MGTIIGYARTATKSLDTASNSSPFEGQKIALAEAGCQAVFEEVCSGMSPLKERSVLMGVIQDLHAGDTLVVCEGTRLSRSMDAFSSILSYLQERGVELHVLREASRAIDPARVLKDPALVRNLQAMNR